MLAARALPPARGVLPLRARASSTARGRRAAAAVVVVPRAAAGKGFDASAVTGGLEKKRCDLCLGTGTRKCYNCQQHGHLSAQCPQPKRERQPANQATSSNAGGPREAQEDEVSVDDFYANLRRAHSATERT